MGCRKFIMQLGNYVVVSGFCGDKVGKNREFGSGGRCWVLEGGTNVIKDRDVIGGTDIDK